MKTYTTAIAISSILCANFVLAGQPTNSNQIKNTIISIQYQVTDLTDPLLPFFCKDFIAARNSMSMSNAVQIVELIRQGNLSPVQSDIGVLLLSGLDEHTYWVVTEQLLNTNTDESVLDDLLGPPMPYGPGYANAYKNGALYKKLAGLKAAREWGSAVEADLNLILSGEASGIYTDYLKHPAKYGYRPRHKYNGNP
jgi:hypothetical protein